MQDVKVDLSGWCEKMQLMVKVGAKSCLRSETPRTLVVAMVILGACYIYVYIYIQETSKMTLPTLEVT